MVFDATFNNISHFIVKFYLGKKFGCPRKKERHLLEVAKKLGLNVVGVR
jgi:hypothetical protein